QASQTTVSANWIGFVDGQSGIAEYQWAIGTTAGGTDLQGFVSMGAGTNATTGALSLAPGQTCYVTVRAVNGAGLTTDLCTDGVAVTTSLPTAGTVNDGTGADADWQTSTTTISANWSGFSDPESGIAGYAWAIGTTSGGTDVQGFLDVGLNMAATAEGLFLAGGQVYFVTVRATNGVGIQTTAVSDGVTIDASGLQSLSAAPGNMYVGLRWEQSPSPDVVGYRLYWCIQGGVWGPVIELGDVTSYIVSGLVNGTTYDFLVTAVDSLGGETSGDIISAAPAANLGITPNVSTGYTPLTVSFTGNAGWSNVLQYSWDFDGDGTDDWSSWTTGDVIHVYSMPGSPAATLTMHVIGGTVTTSQSTLLVIASPIGPPAAGGVSGTNGQAPLTITFAVGESQQIETYLWDIGANGVVEFVKNNPIVGVPGDWVWQHTFTEAGNYAVRLRTVDLLGASSLWTETIIVAPPVPPPPEITTLALAGEPPNGPQPWYPGTWVFFTATGGATVDAYEWDFDGDGACDARYTAAEWAAAGNETRWFYTDPGNHTVSLRVVDEGADPGVPTDDLSTTQALGAPVQIAPNAAVRLWFVWPEDGHIVSGNSLTADVNAVPAADVDFTTMTVEHRPVGAAEWEETGVTLAQTAPPAARLDWDTTAVPDGDYELRASVYAADGSGPYEALITVTIDNGGPADNDTDEIDDGDGRRNNGKVHANRSGRLQTGNPTIAEYALGTFADNNRLTVTFLTENPTASAPFGKAFISAFRRFELTDPMALLLPPLMTIHYPDADNDGLVDGTAIAETTLRIYRFDAEDSRWELILDQKIDAEQNYVVGRAPAFSEFGLAGMSAASGSGGGGGGGGGGTCLLRACCADSPTPVFWYVFVSLCAIALFGRSRARAVHEAQRREDTKSH
ncbi:MAG: hypothetical protein RDV41_08105, partial [Planctomycetota bacterium]|nr:hypothetical protein [Planctomycetota bacterium]